ncbi:MAG: tail sheath stabilizer and completion protein [Candidatus Pacebacteria bacterium]|nr:tail sheath stabilizer and completion protein [Candidatus Paceibacterota bacterium]|tara:strand:+ start:2092 stop:3018 length:927 start_codon:yes stop_codon:yes gene_type:complete
MFGTYFYHQTSRKMVVAFGSLFNNIEVRRTDSSGAVVESLKIPLSYGPKDKMLVRISGDPSLNPKVALTVPRMGFELTAMSYDGMRKLNTVGRNVKSGTTGLKKQYNPVPYNYDFSLYIFVKNAEDGTQILEQILPFFTPEFTVTMSLVSSMGIKMDIPLVLNSVTSEDSYEGDFATRRSIIWTLSFLMKSYLYPDVADNAKVITSVTVDTHLMSDTLAEEPVYIITEDSTAYSTNYFILDSHDYDDSTRMRILTEDSNEEAVAGATVSRATVAPKTTNITDEDFGFSETFSFFPAGKTHDPVSGTDT